jgi:RND family efflux transporter MFP subunit
MTTSPPDLSQLRINRDQPAEPPRRGRMIGAIVAVVVVAVAVTAFVLFGRSRPLEVKVATASATGGGEILGEGISANGYVVARTKASVSAKIPGRLEYLGVREGSNVKRGEVIARIESADYQAALGAARADVAQIEAQLVQARRDLERAKLLEQQKVISSVEAENAVTKVDVTMAQLNASRARTKLAEVNLENTRVRAPFDGTVLRKDAEVGEIVAPASAGGGLTRTAIVTMADLATLEVEVDVNEAYIARVRGGQASRITLDAYPDTSFVGQVRQVVPTADRDKATVQVKVSILDRDPRILPEMGAKVVFLKQEGSADTPAPPRRVMVPETAVVRSAGDTRVWVVANGTVSSRVVETGPSRNDQVEIRSGLAGGESVVVSPPAALKDGARVRVAGS